MKETGRKAGKFIYCAIFLALCLVPSVGMLAWSEATSQENRDLSQMPALVNENGLNTAWLSELGEYFQDHFALRSELVTANAVVYGKGLGTSTASGVIEGTDGWLYYKDSLADYQGSSLMSERSLFNLSHTLSMTQAYLEDRGVAFLFTVAPNKNSLYGEHMPYYYQYKVSEEKNLTNLQEKLAEEGVSYVSLYENFLGEDEVLYHLRDSHWNNKGAALASGWLLDALGKDHTDWSSLSYTVRQDFEGDLDQMLYPLAMTPEDEVYYDEPFTYSYTTEISSTYDRKIETVNAGKEGSLLVYRDSFGNALLQFLAEEYGSAYFDRGEPFNLLNDVDSHSADTVIVERAERFLPELAQNPPKIEAPQAEDEIQKAFEALNEEETDTTDYTGNAEDVTVLAQGLYTRVTGRISSVYLDTTTRIFVQVNGGVLYEACPMDVGLTDGSTDSGGFSLYLPAGQFTEEENQVELFCSTDGQLVKVYEEQCKEEKLG